MYQILYLPGKGEREYIFISFTCLKNTFFFFLLCKEQPFQFSGEKPQIL